NRLVIEPMVAYCSQNDRGQLRCSSNPGTQSGHVSNSPREPRISSGCAVIQDLCAFRSIKLGCIAHMPLSHGEKLSHYEILFLLGKGSMGEVYSARDTRLKREVALRVFPDSFATDPDRMARFQREAELLASLNHP